MHSGEPQVIKHKQWKTTNPERKRSGWKVSTVVDAANPIAATHRASRKRWEEWRKRIEQPMAITSEQQDGYASKHLKGSGTT